MGVVESSTGWGRAEAMRGKGRVKRRDLVLAVRRATAHSLSRSTIIYENICFIFDHSARDCRVFHFVPGTKEGRDHSNDGRSYDNSRGHNQEDHRQEEDCRGRRVSFASRVTKEEGRDQEGG